MKLNRLLGGALMVGVMALTFYFMITYTGPFQWLAELQLKWWGSYEETITFLLTFILTALPAGALVLLEMEHRGVLLDGALLRKQSSEIGAKLVDLQTRAHAAAGGEFNLDSPKQLQQILFEKHQLPVIRKTPTGQPSTAEDVLERLPCDAFIARPPDFAHDLPF